MSLDLDNSCEVTFWVASGLCLEIISIGSQWLFESMATGCVDWTCLIRTLASYICETLRTSSDNISVLK
jgi:hypothetical protein